MKIENGKNVENKGGKIKKPIGCHVLLGNDSNKYTMVGRTIYNKDRQQEKAEMKALGMNKKAYRRYKKDITR